MTAEQLSPWEPGYAHPAAVAVPPPAEPLRMAEDATPPSTAVAIDREARLDSLRVAYAKVKSVDCILFQGEVQATLSLIEMMANRLRAVPS